MNVAIDEPPVLAARQEPRTEWFRAARRAPDVQLADSPWRLGDLRRVSVRVLLGLIGVVTAWFGASGTVIWRDQMIWLAIAIAAAVVAASAEVLWLMVGLGAVRRERRETKGLLRGYMARNEALPTGERDRRAGLVWSPGMAHWHRDTCDVVLGKHVVAVSRREREQRGLAACGMCQP